MEAPSVELRDEHLEPLRRFMVGDVDGLDVFDRDPEDHMAIGAWWLLVAGFSVAAQWRFGNPFTRRAIIEFVAELRISLGKDRDDVDPKVAEDWIRTALGDLTKEEQLRVHENPAASATATLYILDKLRDENIVSEAGLDAFLEAAMDYAKSMQERLPTVWDEVRPLIEAQHR